MTTARARRRLMAWERYTRRARLLGADHLNERHGLVSRGHAKAWEAADYRMFGRRGWPWALTLHRRRPP